MEESWFRCMKDFGLSRLGRADGDADWLLDRHALHAYVEVFLVHHHNPGKEMLRPEGGLH